MKENEFEFFYFCLYKGSPPAIVGNSFTKEQFDLIFDCLRNLINFDKKFKQSIIEKNNLIEWMNFSLRHAIKRSKISHPENIQQFYIKSLEILIKLANE